MVTSAHSEHWGNRGGISMADKEIFATSVRPPRDLAGVFEFEGEVGYFYLYSLDESEGRKILDSLHILTGVPDFSKSDVKIRWDSEEQKVGLFIKGVLWAVFIPALGAK